MDLRDVIETVDISLMDPDSTINSEEDFILNTDTNHTKYIASCLMKELLILIEFKNKINLHFITIHALLATTERDNDDDDESDNDDGDIDISAPKTIHICHIDNLDSTLEDIKEIKPTKTIHCTPDALDKGQTIHLHTFTDIQYVAVYIESNQNDTESTYLNGITFCGECIKEQIEPETEHKAASEDNKQDSDRCRRHIPCICGGELTEMLASDASLNLSDDITCSQCSSYLNDVSKIYHCKNGSNNWHLKGYDLCQACADFETKLKELYPNEFGPAKGIPLQYTGMGIIPSSNMIVNNTYQPPDGTKKSVRCICGYKLTEVKAEDTYSNNKPASVQCDRCFKHLNGTTIVYHCENESNIVHYNGYDLCEVCADWMVGIQQMYLLQYGAPQGVPMQRNMIAQQANMTPMQQNQNPFANQMNVQSFPPTNKAQSAFNKPSNETQGVPMQNTITAPQANTTGIPQESNRDQMNIQVLSPNRIQFEFDRSDNRTQKHLSEMLKSDDSDQKIESCRFDAGSLFDCNVIHFRSESCKLETCDSLKRLSTVLYKYHLYISTLQQDLIDTIYDSNYTNTALLNDFNHLLLSHSNQFEDIYNILIKNNNENPVCSLTKCVMVRRNRRNRAKEDNDLYFDQDETNTNKQQLLDKIHSYYYHSFDTGYKLTREDRQKIMNDSKIDNEHEFDHTVTDIYVRRCGNIIRKRKAVYENVDALNENDTITNKYTLNTNVLEYSYGIRFFYWKWYKNNLDINDYAHPAAGSADIDTQRAPNGEGVRLKEWYISPKYTTFKQELMNNAICNLSLCNWRKLEIKAKDHLQSNIVRQFICSRTLSALCFEMKHGDPMTINHLIALMVYCNFGTLARKFTETFRRHQSETNQAMKERHRNFYYLGRLLRECVECFGMMNSWRANEYKTETMLVFHGINRQFMFESLNAFIKGPTSTTTDYAVALNFCGAEGMILQLSIRVSDWVLKYNEGELPKTRISCFDMQWISDFPNESEIFTFGGLNKFSFDTIIDASLSMNYKLYIKGLQQMTYQMSSGDLSANESKAPLSKEEKVIVYRMLSHQLYTYAPESDHAHEFKSCPKYMQKIVRKHCESIESISFESKLLQETMENVEHWRLHDALFKYDNEWIKLDAVMKVFPNTKQITYNCCRHDKDVEFMKQSAIYHSILDFIQHNPKTKLMNIGINMTLDLAHISAEVNTRMCQDVIFNIQHFIPEFFKLCWQIDAGVHEPVPPGIFTINMMNLNVQ